MSRRHYLASLWFGLALPIALTAQDPTTELANRLAAVLVPATDDLDAQVRAMLELALAHVRSPVAALLASEARSRADDVADPAALRTWLQQAQNDRKPTGLLAQRLRELDWRLWRRAGGTAPADPLASYARNAEVIGPFGSGNGPWLDESLPIDAGFPARGERVAGRFGDVTVRTVQRAPDRHALSLLDPQDPRQGACCLRWRVAIAAESTGFVEVEYAGAMRLSVDDVELGRTDPLLQPGNAVQRFAVHLLPGEHAVLVRTGDGSQNAVALRLVDASGEALATAGEVDPATPAAAPATGDPRDAGTYRDALTALEQVATAATGDSVATLRTAAAWAAARTGETDRLLALLLQLQPAPPTTPTERLLLADLWRRAEAWPEEQRNAAARDLEDAAIKALPAEHLGALLAQVRQHEDKDRGEDAIRLLRRAIDAGRAGPQTFAALAATCRRLKFTAEEGAVVAQWAERCPRDLRPRLRLAERQNELGDPAGALAFYQQALTIQPYDDGALRAAMQLAFALGKPELLPPLLDRLFPPSEQDRARGLWRLQTETTAALRRGDVESARKLLDQQARHPAASPDDQRRVVDRALLLGDRDRALASIEQLLRVQTDDDDLQTLRARLGAGKVPGADFAKFRRDGDAAIAAFQPSARDGEAPTSLCIDQRIVELLPDGSYTVEVHELRRINDLTGVESLDNAHAAAAADDLLAIRTIDKQGRSFVPVKVQDGFSMPRLEPGAFVEWRYREHGGAPGTDPLRLEEFLFGSAAEPLHVSEYVLIVPAKTRGQLRLRNLGKPSREEALDDDRRALVFTRTDVARLPNESSPPAVRELVPVAEYGEDAQPWPQLRQIRTALLARSRPTPPIRAFAQQQLADVKGDAERLRVLYAFTQQEIADGNASDATEVLLTKKGNRFLLLLALLRAADVDAVPAACREIRPELAADGAPLFADADPASMPAILVRPRDAAPVWLFADAPRHLPLGTIPAQRSGALAFVLGRDGAVSTQLPTAATAVQDLVAAAQARFDSDALVAQGSVTIGDLAGFGIADQVRRRTKDVRAVAARQLLQQVFAGWRVRSSKLADLEPPGKPLQIDFEVQNAGLQADGDGRWLLPLPLPPSDLRDSFGDREQRSVPLRLTHDVHVRHRLTIDPGDDREFGALPAPLLIAFGPLEYHLVFERDGRKVVIDRRLRLQPATLPVAVYADWLRVLTDVDRAEKQSLPLRKARAAR